MTAAHVPGRERLALTVAGLLCVLALSAAAQPQGRPVLKNGRFDDGEPRPTHWVTRDSGALGTFTILPAQEGNESGILAVDIGRESSRPWTLELRQTLDSELIRGETVYLTFEYLISTGYSFHVYWQKDSPPWPKMLALRISEPSGKWERVMVAVPVHDDFKPRETSLSFHLAEGKGKALFRDIALVAMPPEVDPANLATNVEPVFGGDYYDNDWRTSALERLERIRKSDLTVKATRNGEPVADVPVSITQTARPFSFGVEVEEALMVDGGLDFDGFRRMKEELGDAAAAIPKYREKVHDRTLFDTLVLPSAFIWREFDAWGNKLAPIIAEEAARNGQRVRGHALYCPAFVFAPPRWRGMNKEELIPEIDGHITDRVTEFKDTVSEWNVLHDVLTFDEIYQTVGAESLVRAYWLAKRANPDAALFLSDDKALPEASEAHLNELLELLGWLEAEGAQVAGLVLGARLKPPYIAPQAMETRLDAIAAKTTVPVYVGSLEVEVPNEKVQAAMLRDLILCFFSHPAVRGVSFSGIWEGPVPHARSPLFRTNFAIKPAGKEVEGLLTQEWRTEAGMQTDAAGEARARAFIGTYEIRVGAGENMVVQTVELPAEGAVLEIPLP